MHIFKQINIQKFQYFMKIIKISNTSLTLLAIYMRNIEKNSLSFYGKIENSGSRNSEKCKIQISHNIVSNSIVVLKKQHSISKELLESLKSVKVKKKKPKHYANFRKIVNLNQTY